jgi:invasion protein IalB
MDDRIAWPRPFGRVLGATAAAVLVAAATLMAAPPALAQKKPAAKPAPQAAQNNQPQLMYSPWMKVCGKGQDTNNKQVCVVTKDGRLENGMPVAIVQLFEPEGQPKILRVTVPLGMQLQHGTRVIIDQDTPVNEP